MRGASPLPPQRDRIPPRHLDGDQNRSPWQPWRSGRTPSQTVAGVGSKLEGKECLIHANELNGEKKQIMNRTPASEQTSASLEKWVPRSKRESGRGGRFDLLAPFFLRFEIDRRSRP